MPEPSSRPQYSYVAYIDESGDPGLRRVKPHYSDGSSEWLIVAAAVISADNEPQVGRWVQSITANFRNHQRYGVHFADLNEAKKRAVCSAVATLPLRLFVVASNKKNMEGYKNPFAEKIPSDNWFYCWMTRLLLERVTLFVRENAKERYREARLLKLEYSNRGGLSYGQMNAYYEWLKMRSKAGQLVLPLGDLCWETMHRELFHVFNHNERLGLHLADIAAGAFFKAADKYDTGGCDPQFARLLSPRMARHPDGTAGLVAGYGLKLMPSLRKAKLDADQSAIFLEYGYPKQWWAPDPTTPTGS